MPITPSENEKQSVPKGLPVPFADRQKYWSELENDERIERLRTLVKIVVAENNSLRAELRVIKEHTHDKDGKAVIVKPLRDEYGGNNILTGSSYKEDPSKVYI